MRVLAEHLANAKSPLSICFSRFSIYLSVFISFFDLPPASSSNIPYSMAPANAALHAVKNFRFRELTLSKNWLPRAHNAPSHVSIRLHNPFLPQKNPETGRWAPSKYSRRRQAELVKKARASNTLHLLPPGPKLSLKQLKEAFATAPSTPAPIQSSALFKVSTSTSVKHQQTSSVKAEEKTETSPVAKSLDSEPLEIVQGVGQPWNVRVKWVGKVTQKKEVGSRLYARKKRMFKGHKWERTQKSRETRRAILMRDMQKRIIRYKTVRVISSIHHHCCRFFAGRLLVG